MNNPITFKYNGRKYNPKNPEKKLKQLGITWNDVEIIEEPKQEEKIEYEDIVTYKFINNKTGGVIISIYDNLDDLKDIVNINDYVKC